MPLENTITIEGLNTSWPLGGDGVAAGDDHIRQQKTILKNIFPLLIEIKLGFYKFITYHESKSDYLHMNT